MDEKRKFDEAVHAIEKTEIVILRNMHGFPVYRQDIILPYLMIFICHSGSARALYDMKEIVFCPNEVAIVLPNHIIHSIESTPDYNVTIIIHSPTFEQEMTRHRLKHDRNKFHALPACMLTDDELMEYMKAVDMLEVISRTPESRFPNRREMLLAQTDIMVEMMDAYRQETDTKPEKDSRKQLIFHEFSNALAIHYREQHEVAFYAEKAHLTARHFSVIIKEVVGLSASDYIEQYLVTQARNLLATRPDLSVQQISYHLGYADSPSFCRFFKRMTDQTPKEFRALEKD